MIYAGIWESGLTENDPANSLGYGGILAGSTQVYSVSDTAGQATGFLNGDGHRSFQGPGAGGAIAAAASGITNPVEIAVRVEVPSIWPSNAYAAESGYPGDSAATAEAAAIVSAFGGGQLPGGTAGLGGTGTAQNAAQPQPFTIGDTSNPHEDYWTGINRLAQDRYWYVFSDSESVYLADGPDLMAQAPVITLDRLDNANQINHLSFTWDNTAWTFAVNHKRKARIQHRSQLAKVTSPVEAQLDLICEIDEVRGGDVIMLTGCGPGDGKWLVADCTRSIFAVFSTITLVPALSPLTEQQVAGASPTNTGAPGVTPTGTAGGFVSPFKKKYTATLANVDQGVDFGTQQGISPGDPILAIADCYFTSTNTFYAGQPVMWFQFKNHNQYWGWYVSEQINMKLSPSSTTLIPAGTVVATFASSGTGIEIGWAGADGQTATQALHPSEVGGRHSGNGTTDGRAFLAFLQSVGAV